MSRKIPQRCASYYDFFFPYPFSGSGSTSAGRRCTSGPRRRKRPGAALERRSSRRPRSFRCNVRTIRSRSERGEWCRQRPKPPSPLASRAGSKVFTPILRSGLFQARRRSRHPRCSRHRIPNYLWRSRSGPRLFRPRPRRSPRQASGSELARPWLHRRAQ